VLIGVPPKEDEIPEEMRLSEDTDIKIRMGFVRKVTLLVDGGVPCDRPGCSCVGIWDSDNTVVNYFWFGDIFQSA